MSTIRGFPPILPRRPRALILGSMPSVASLDAGQYYAHPRNAFWPAMAAAVGFQPSLPYRRRVAALRAAGIAVWDVLGCCQRKGSLDSAIVPASETPNPIDALLARHASIGAVFFNGRKAEAAFRRHILPALDGAVRARLRFVALPSTSPANARLDLRRKIAAWAVVAAWRAPAGGRPRAARGA